LFVGRDWADIHRLPVLAPTLPETLDLQALTRQRDDQLGLRIAASTGWRHC
jgi:hypothetical protein